MVKFEIVVRDNLTEEECYELEGLLTTVALKYGTFKNKRYGVQPRCDGINPYSIYPDDWVVPHVDLKELVK